MSSNDTNVKEMLCFMLEEKFSCLDKDNQDKFIAKKFVINNENIAMLLFEVKGDFPAFLDLALESDDSKYKCHLHLAEKISIGYDGECNTKIKGNLRAVGNLINSIESFSYILEKAMILFYNKGILSRVECRISKTRFNIWLSYTEGFSTYNHLTFAGHITDKKLPIKVSYKFQKESFTKEFVIHFNDLEQINTEEDLDKAFMDYYTKKNAIHHK